MFAPSFVTGSIIRKLGELQVMFIGGLMGFACVAINLAGSSIIHFCMALVLLGLSLSFLFVDATSLLTRTYSSSERFKVQALNDFMNFSAVALASLSAGYLQFYFGWRSVNVVVLPILAVILLSIILLAAWQKKQSGVAA